MWNTDITYDIYHFNHKSENVVQLELFILEILPTYVYTSLSLTAGLNNM